MKLLNFISVLMLFLFVLSGRFTLARVGLGDLEVRYVFLASLLISFFVLMSHDKRIADGLKFAGSLPIFLFFVFLISATLSAFYSPDLGVALQKLLDILVVFIVFMISCYLFKDFNNIKIFLVLFALVGMLYSLLVLSSIGAGSDGRGTIGVGGPNVATRIIFLGLMSIVIISFMKRRVYLLLASPFYLAGIVGVGSRGGMVAAIISIALLIVLAAFDAREFIGKKVATVKLRHVFIFFLSVVFLFISYKVYFPLVQDIFRRRFINLLIERLHFAGRDELLGSSLYLIDGNEIFGIGLAGYRNVMVHPHNLFLELLLDGGVFLVLAFLPTLLYMATLFSRLKGLALPIFVSCIYMLIVQMFSGDFYDFRYYFVYYAMLILWVKRHQKHFFHLASA